MNVNDQTKSKQYYSDLHNFVSMHFVHFNKLNKEYLTISFFTTQFETNGAPRNTDRTVVVNFLYIKLQLGKEIKNLAQKYASRTFALKF